MIQSFKSMIPVVHPSAFVHPQATVLGHVTIGPDCYIGPGAVLRGDWGRIVLEAGCNVQEQCVVHMFPGTTVHMAEGAHVGHGAIIHGAQLGANCLIGMNSVLMDDVKIGEGCIVGALAFVKAGSIWTPRSLIVGNPAKKIGEVSDEMLSHKTEGTALYRSLPKDMADTLRITDPLETVTKPRHEDFPDFETWQARKGH